MRRLTGNRCQCPTCGAYFNGLAGFDAHRIGPFDGTRRCLTVAEMEARGWVRNDAGFWVTDSHAQRATRPPAGGFPASRATPAMQPHCPTVRASETLAPAGAP